MDEGSHDTEFDELIEEYHQALDAFARGDVEPAKRLYSQREDISLGNPFGPFAIGWPEVVAAMTRAAANYRDGEAVGFDRIAKQVTPSLAYLVEVERLSSKIGGRAERMPVDLRVTSVFRREAGRWRLIHRHADPITSSKPAESVISS
jgi:ketosteroid isomerase-like protein